MAMLEQEPEGVGAAAAPAAVDEAARRLEAALGRLEGLVERRGAREGELRAALARAREENAELQALVERLAERVDLAVGRLEEVLED